jgi:hypothetical protein
VKKISKEENIELLVDIKKLLILGLLNNGLTTAEVGRTLGVSYKTIERMLPKKSKGK